MQCVTKFALGIRILLFFLRPFSSQSRLDVVCFLLLQPFSFRVLTRSPFLLILIVVIIRCKRVRQPVLVRPFKRTPFSSSGMPMSGRPFNGPCPLFRVSFFPSPSYEDASISAHFFQHSGLKLFFLHHTSPPLPGFPLLSKTFSGKRILQRILSFPLSSF